MAAPSKVIAAGTKFNFLGFYNTDGFLVGGTPTGASTGSSSGMALLRGLKTAAPATPAPEVVSVTGDDELLGEFEFDSVEQRTFVADYAVSDAQIEADLLGVNQSTIAGIRMVPNDIKDAAVRTVCVLFNGRAKSQDAGSGGAERWVSKLVTIASAKPLGRTAFTEREAAVFQLSISPQLATNTAWGVTIETSVQGTTAYRYETWYSDYPAHMVAIRGNNSATTFNLDYEPVSASLTAAYVNRSPVTVSSVSASAKTATLSSAPASGAWGLLIYQFQP